MTSEQTRTIYIIKPEAYESRELIKECMIRAGFSISASKDLVLPEFALDIIYPQMPSVMSEIILKYMRIGLSQVGLVQKNNAIQELLCLSGCHVDPMQCKPGTIRHVFGIAKPSIVGECVYYLNGFHRSVNAKEAHRDACLFASL